ncbi:MAG TPA: ferrochelatase [Caulobacteraceae bacterium]|nr:ferrochelatase [Caulobacteraceae bacterium]
MSTEARVAVVLFNLGGPDSLAAVRPFLENLFSDPEIIGAPAVVRPWLARAIARTRASAARRNYAHMGGGSPLLRQTRAQAEALERRLEERLAPAVVRTFVAMRYWRPMTEAAAAEVTAFDPGKVVLLPLYPQFSRATSGSSLDAWNEIYRGHAAIHGVCCWPAASGLVAAHVERILTTWEAAGRPTVRLLFSAHGLPTSLVRAGDPYQWQIEQTCAEIAARLPGAWAWRVCYQSKVGPMPWLGPSTAQELVRAGDDRIGVIIDPVSFVSEHVETLVELDRDYRRIAERARVPVFLRCATAGDHPALIDAMANAVEGALGRPGVGPDGVACPPVFARCWRRGTDRALV